ncbi:Zn-ribbon domain-containing OB-fold protein [Metabacillus arenae]|uniref:OB-fold domain-containing protein n=1 Tax=Metabacillus arenae TaxID=2771434 RepID=A0A926RUU1_9BACI|nr:OB-fold domain-containing protein [Metabacillus arenae]MBD1378933.1 OB-fold domain-containing protein [Metabacillus arenae]
MDITLLICEKCDKKFIQPKYACPNCHNGDLIEKKTSGKGTIYSFTTIYTAPEMFTSQVPYHIVLVDLDNGPRITARMVDGEPIIDRKVELVDIENSVYWFSINKD